MKMPRYYCALISNDYQEEIYYFNASDFNDASKTANQLCEDLAFDNVTYKVKLLKEEKDKC